MNKTPREAIIFIPGLTQRGARDKSIEAFSYRIKKAIDINYPDGSYKFGLEIQKKTFGKDNKMECKMASVFRYEKQGQIPVCDIYELDYATELVSKFEDRNVLIKTLLLFHAIVSKFPRLLYVTLHAGIRGISLRKKIQIFLGSFILFCLSAYGVILVTALLAGIGSELNLYNMTSLSQQIEFPQDKFSDFLHDIFKYIYYVFAWIFSWIWTIIASVINIIHVYKKYIVGSAAAIVLILPGFKNMITNAATDYLCLINYLNIGDRRLTVNGKFEELLEYITEQEINYATINVYSYSFGSIVALDILFPYDGITSERIKTKVNTLVTIGCPFDFIRVYWPDYYKNRKECNLKLKAWYNIHSELDVLSSNFRNDGKDGDAMISIAQNKILPRNIYYNVIAPDSVSFIDMIMLQGLRAHALYWDDSEFCSSCFTNLFQEMKEDFVYKDNEIKKTVEK